MQVNLNQAAFCTVTGLGVVTVGCALAAASAASTAAVVAFSMLAIGNGALSISAISAWIQTRSTNGAPNEYFETMKDHAMVTIPVFAQMVAQIAVQAITEGVAQGIKNIISRRISGADHTYRQV